MNFGEGRMQNRFVQGDQTVFTKPGDVGFFLTLFCSHGLQNPFVQDITFTKFPLQTLRSCTIPFKAKELCSGFWALKTNLGW